MESIRGYREISNLDLLQPVHSLATLERNSQLALRLLLAQQLGFLMLLL